MEKYLAKDQDGNIKVIRSKTYPSFTGLDVLGKESELVVPDCEYRLMKYVDGQIVEDAATKTTEVKTLQITSAYSLMNGEVLAEMASVFGTSNPDSAVAYERTWDMMAAAPNDWAAAGLKAQFAAGGLAIGDALDTAQKITDYSAAKIAEVKAYGIWRMQRIEQFKAEKAAIEAQ